MTSEEVLRAARKFYPGVYLSVAHDIRTGGSGNIIHTYRFWHAGANQHVGPAATAADLWKMILQWEDSGERHAACDLQAAVKRAEEARDKVRLSAWRTKADPAPDDEEIDLGQVTPPGVEIAE